MEFSRIFSHLKTDFKIDGEKCLYKWAITKNNQSKNIKIKFNEKVVCMSLSNDELKKLPRFNFFITNNWKTYWFITSQNLVDINELKSIKKISWEALSMYPVNKEFSFGKVWVDWKEQSQIYLENAEWKPIEDFTPNTKAQLRFFKRIIESANKKLEVNIEEEYLIENINNNLTIKDVFDRLPEVGWPEIDDNFLILPWCNIVLDLKWFENNYSWTPFNVVYNHYKEKKDTFKFFETYFGFKLSNDITELSRIDVDNTVSLVFNNNSVEIINITQEAEKIVKVLNVWIKVIWYFETNIRWKHLTDEEYICYVCKRLDTDEIIHLEYQSTKNKFNDKNWAKWIRFLSSDKWLNYFWDAFDILKSENKIHKYKVVHNNWIDIKQQLLTHGGEILYHNKDIKYTINMTKEYAIRKWHEQISIKDFYEKLKEVYDSSIMTITYLWWLWAFLRDVFLWLWIRVPILFAVWETQSGKNSLIEIIMWALWYEVLSNRTERQTRILALEWTTPQPLLESLKDKTPIFLDEFTWWISRWIEEIMRAAFNNETISKGRPSYNIIYELQAPICVAWERMPHYVSVINRTILLRYRLENRLLTSDKINLLKEYRDNYSILDDIWNHCMNKDIEDISVEADLWIWRVSENWKFIIIVNRLFQIISEEQLIEYIQEHINYQNKNLSLSNELDRYFNELFWTNINKRSIIAKYNNDNDLVITLYAWPWIMINADNQTRLLIDLLDRFGGSWDFIQINMTKLQKDSQIDDDSRKFFNRACNLLEKVQDVVIMNWLEETVWIRASDLNFNN